MAPGEAELRPATIGDLRPGDALVRSLYSGLSRGTERLIFEGKVPEMEWSRMKAPAQEGEFPFPVKYGYSAVGVAEEGPAEIKGKNVFALYPHQDRFVIPAERAFIIPDNVPPRRATLAANMETALNILWDGNAQPADKIVIVGGGIVGMLVASLASRLPGADVTLIDIEASREAITKKLGVGFALPDKAPGEADLVIHTTASAAGLSLALKLAGVEGTIVEASWFGTGMVNVALGDAFHSRRLRLISSQVGNVCASRAKRWTTRRRLEAAIGMLADDRLDALLGEEVPFAELPQQLSRLLSPKAPGLGALICY
ncbi:MAG: zinc-binding alcohol dehydrogenase [Xanthobacteraceae bacterium]|nr:zinc-binding alcohol dehydrogenase [Xanthobacteraceae bacterium]MBX3522349.1 zinc-binding alcohol dehydrogenase [Xanthobacteraceae bacterium]MBX3535287.1 zinc-binding alcohol dehydrogenase [Xanthobacteraceae bacterium]MBX3548409.1 zinc-binding alcohol dehydrogenase [Xanthobacteraceae bacterium]MCW5674079.1 zinc-binding alcohol dehydrogenase [Xanthobacteraceae bacterium]